MISNKFIHGLCILYLSMIMHSAFAASKETIKIGILAYRPKAQTTAQWQPLANYFNQQLPAYHFIIEALAYPDLNTAIASHQIDFVLTNPSHYIYLKSEYGLSSPLASLIKRNGKYRLSAFAGVIFTLSSRSDINTLQDIRYATIAATKRSSLGGFQMQSYALFQADLPVPTNKQLLLTGMPHDKVVAAVLNKQADVGFIRTGVLEALHKERGLDLSQFKLINQQTIPSFPFVLSTSLYPEWPIAALPHIDPKLASHFTAALLLLHGKTTQQIGFTMPMDYLPVEQLLRALRAPPFNKAPRFTLHDIWHRYTPQLRIAGLLFILIVTLSVTLLVFNRRLQKQKQYISREAKKHLTLLSSLAEGVYGIDSKGNCNFINPAALLLLGYTEAEIIGKNPHQLFHRHLLNPQDSCPISKTLRNGKTRQCEDIFWHKSGHNLAVLMNISSIVLSDTDCGAVVAFKDISVEKQITARNEMLVTALTTSQTGTVITNTQAIIEWVNMGEPSL